MSDLVKFMRRAKRLIDAPEKWTKGAYARNFDGRSVDWGHEAACRFCSVGALGRVCDDSSEVRKALGLRTRAKSILIMHAGAHGGIASFNDSHTHAEVMAMWDRAIKYAEGLST